MNICPVTVIIPCYNRQEFLGRAINSVMSQTLPCAEIVVVDDGSTDNTGNVVRDFMQHSAKITIRYVHQSNRGPAAARNSGVRLSRTPYLAFLDSDDHWLKNKLAIQFTQLADHSQFLISHTCEKWLRRGEHLNQKKKHRPRHGDIFSHCLQLCAVGMSTVMMKKELFDEVGFFDESLPCCEDYDFWLRISCRYPFLLIEQPLTVKEGGRTDQVSAIFRVGMDRFRIQSLEKLLQSGQLNDYQHRLAAAELKRKIEIFASGCFKHGKQELGQTYINKLNTFQTE